MEKRIENGFVCFFDILGYKNILKNNDIDKCAVLIRDIILKLPKQIQGFISTPKSDSNIPHIYEYVEHFLNNHLQTITVSDSILVFFDFENIEGTELELCVAASLFYIRAFQLQSFDLGFPTRSCLDYGSYYFYDNVFAGESIINSYIESEKLDFSGIVVTDKAYNYLDTFKNEGSIVQRFKSEQIYSYLCPIKNKVEEQKYLLNWYGEIQLSRDSDLRQYVFDQFHKHNKDVDSRTYQKILNTERLIRYYIFKGKKA